MNIAGKMDEVLVCFHEDRLEWSLVERANPLAFGIEIFRVAIGNIGKKVMDAFRDVLPDEEVKMVRHEAVGENIHGEGLLVEHLTVCRPFSKRKRKIMGVTF